MRESRKWGNVESDMAGNHGGCAASQLARVRVVRRAVGGKAGNDCVPVVWVQRDGQG